MRPFRTLAIAVAALLVLLVLQAVLGPLFRETGAWALDRVGAPLWGAGARVRTLLSRDSETMAARIRDLEAELDALIVENATLRDLREENRTLTGLLGFAARTDAKLIAARVVAGSADPDVHAIDIDRGVDDGVEGGDAVVTADGIVIGKISAVRSRSATVELLTDPRSRFAAALLGKDGAATVAGVVEGGYGTGMVMRLIPETAMVAIGDPVITAGLEAGIPRGLVVGRVESVRKEANDPFQSATLSPLVPLDAVTAVAVVKSPR